MAEIIKQVKFSNEALAAGTAYTSPWIVDSVNFCSIQLNTTGTGTAYVQISNDETTPSNWFDAPTANLPALTLVGTGGLFNISDVATRWMRVKIEMFSGADVTTIAILKDS